MYRTVLHVVLNGIGALFVALRNGHRLQMTVLFWALASCCFVGRCPRFEETQCLHLQGRSDKSGKWHRP
jgi:hypothetical protein